MLALLWIEIEKKQNLIMSDYIWWIYEIAGFQTKSHDLLNLIYVEDRRISDEIS